MGESRDGRRWPADAAFAVLPVVVLDGSGATVVESPATEHLLDADASDRTDVLDELVHPQDAATVAATFVDVEDGRRSQRRIAFRSRSDPDRIFELELFDAEAASPGKDVDDPSAASVVGVVSERTRSNGGRKGVPDLGDLLDRFSRTRTPTGLVRAALRWGSWLPGVDLQCHLYDAESGDLEAVRLPDHERSDRDGPEERDLRDVYREGVPEMLAGGDADRFELAVPIGDHGVLVARSTGRGMSDARIRRVATVLGALVGLGLDRLGFARSLGHAVADARESNADYERLTTLTNAVRRAEDRILRADSPEEVRDVLCEELTATAPFSFAWIGEVDFREAKLVPRAWAGQGRPYVDRIDLALGADDPPPAVAAASTRERHHERNVAGGVRTAPWRREALASGFTTAMAVPIGDDTDLVGILSVYTRDRDGFGEHARLAIAHLGRFAGFAINALELRKTFFGTTSVEVKLHVPSTEPALSRFAREIDARVDVLSVVPGTEGASRVFFTVDAEPETVLATADRVPGIGTVRHHADRADPKVFEATVTDGSLLRAVTARGAVLSAVSATPDGLELVVRLGRDVDVRTYVESVRMDWPDAEIVARRVREEAIETGHRYRADYEDQLSDRQREVFEAAYFGGYFEWPRDRTGSEIAASLGIAQPTFSRHLRAAQRKLGALLFESGD